MVEIIIDRLTDQEIIIVSVKKNNVLINESYSFDISKTDEEINTFVNSDLSNKNII